MFSKALFKCFAKILKQIGTSIIYFKQLSDMSLGTTYYSFTLNYSNEKAFGVFMVEIDYHSLILIFNSFPCSQTEISRVMDTD